MTVELITKEDLIAFKEDLVQEIKRLLATENKNSDGEQWLRSSHVRKLMHISPGTLQNLRIQGKLRFTKIGSLIYYSRKDVEQLMGAK